MKNNPERLGLDDSVAQSARLRIDGVIVTGIGNDIKPPVLTSNGVFAKSNCAVSQSLSVVNPIGITAPTVVNWVPCSARAQLSSRTI